MPCPDCHFAPLPRPHRAACGHLARVSEQVPREDGALRFVECWLDAAGPGAEPCHADAARLAACATD